MSDRSDAGAVNGASTLSERVRELRIADKLEGKKGSNNTSWLPWILCVMLAVGWAGFGIKWYNTAQKKEDPNALINASEIAASQGKSSNTNTKTNEQAAPLDAILLEVKGYLIPTQQISISPIDVAGRVVKLNIEEGMSFKKGQILAEIDPTPFNALIAESKANVASAEARYEELRSGSRPEEIEQARAELEDARATLEQYRKEWERLEKSSSNAAGLSRREYEQAESNFRSGIKKVEARQKAYDLILKGPRQERIVAAEAELNAAKARLRQSEWKLENCTIRSPVTGVILTKKAEIGSLLNPVVGGVSTNLCDIADLRKLEVDLEVQERDISKIQLNMMCRIKADAWPAREYEGYVERVMPIANRAKSVVPVRIKVIPRDDDLQGQYLKPEMSVTVTFINRIIQDSYREAIKQALENDAKMPVKPAQPQKKENSTERTDPKVDNKKNIDKK